MKERHDVINRIISVVTIVILVAGLLPLIYCAFFNYATGDDFLNGSYTHHAVKAGGGLVGVLLAAARWARDAYSSQGTFTSLFLFSLQPGIWNERLYIITPFVAIIIFSIGTVCILKIFSQVAGLNRWVSIVAFCEILFLATQYMPYIRGGLFWWTGMVHYTFPFGIVLISSAALYHWVECGKRGAFILAVMFCAYLGGAGYPTVVLSIVLMFFLLGYYIIPGFNHCIEPKARYRAALIIAPFLAEMMGFVISAASPGNKGRGGESFGFTPNRVLMAIAEALRYGILESAKHIMRVDLLVPGLLLLFLFSFSQIDLQKDIGKYRHPIWATIAGYLAVSSVYTPRIFADVYVSGGVYDVEYYTLVFVLVGLTIYYAGFLKTKGRTMSKSTFYICILVSICYTGISARQIIKESSAYLCIDYIRSGAIYDYRTQMEERLQVLENPEITNVVLPEINDYQGPLMHMPLGPDPDAYTNRVTREYYEKASVIAIPRSEYEE